MKPVFTWKNQVIASSQMSLGNPDRPKIIHAEGEFMASEQLAQAAAVLARQPLAVTLRYLQTATEIAGDKNSTLVFPLPMDLISAWMPAGDPGSEPGST